MLNKIKKFFCKLLGHPYNWSAENNKITCTNCGEEDENIFKA